MNLWTTNNSSGWTGLRPEVSSPIHAPHDLPPAAPASRGGGWLSEVKDQLRAIERLPAGWDSNGADPPQPVILRAALTLLECLADGGPVPKPHVNPTRTGGVQFEWESGSRYFELEVDSERSAAYFFQDEISRTEVEGRVSVGEPLEPILDFVRRVGGGERGGGTAAFGRDCDRRRGGSGACGNP